MKMKPIKILILATFIALVILNGLICPTSLAYSGTSSLESRGSEGDLPACLAYAAQSRPDDFYAFNATRMLNNFKNRGSYVKAYGVTSPALGNNWETNYYNYNKRNCLCLVTENHSGGLYQVPCTVMTLDGQGNVETTTIDLSRSSRTPVTTRYSYTDSEYRTEVKYIYQMAYYAMKANEAKETWCTNESKNSTTPWSTLLRNRGFRRHDDYMDTLGLYKGFWPKNYAGKGGSDLTAKETEAKTYITEAFNGTSGKPLPQARFVFMCGFKSPYSTPGDGQNMMVFHAKAGTVTTGSLQIVKKDQANPNKRLKGAKFQIYQIIGTTEKLLATKKTNASGVINYNGVKIGNKYKVVKTKAPAGYLITGNDTQTFTAVAGTKVLEFEDIKASQNISITVVKNNPITNEPVEGARFNIFKYVTTTNSSYQRKKELYKKSDDNKYVALSADEYPPAVSLPASIETDSNGTWYLLPGQTNKYSCDYYSKVNLFAYWKTSERK